MRGEVVKITKAEVTLKIDGTDQVLPLDLLDPRKGVLVCYKAVGSKFDAVLRKDMGAYFTKKKLYDEAEEELKAAVSIDAALKAQVDPLLDQIKAAREPSKPAVAQTVPEKDKPKDPKELAKEKPEDDSSPSDSPADLTKRGVEDFLAKFRKRDVPAKSPAEMKAWLETRKKELEDQIGGTWRMIETAHFYCFANIKEDKHKMVATKWNEELFYDRVRNGCEDVSCITQSNDADPSVIG